MSDELFERELKIFQEDLEQGTQFWFAFLAVHEVAYRYKSAEALLNRAPLFWNTCAGALQAAAYIALGRLFDLDARSHSISRLLRIAHDHPEIFSKAALRRRMLARSAELSEHVDNFVGSAYEATPADFSRIGARVRKWRRIYETKYRDVRHKYFAHRQIWDRTEIAALFAKGTPPELERMFAFLGALREALWQLFVNGKKPLVRPTPYSVKRMLRKRSPKLPIHVGPYLAAGHPVQQEITQETKAFLKFAARK